MRTLLAIVIGVGGMLSSHSTADARELRRRAQPPYYFAPPSSNPREQSPCEDRAQNADPAGRYAGYPCWAREVFSRQPR
jgi:hypothetical protein